MRNSRVHLLAGAVALTLSLTACGAGSADESASLSDDGLGGADVARQLEELYDAAVEGRQTRIVTYGPGEERYASVYEAFSKRYPEIEVQPEYIFGADLATRLDQEYGSGNHVGSIVNGGPNITLLTSGQDRCESYAPVTADSLDSSVVGPDDTYHGFGRWVFGPLYNSDEMSEDEAPTSWADLVDSRFEGKLVLTDPTIINDSSVTLMSLLYGEVVDESWVEGLGANEPAVVANSQLAGQAVASGQHAVSVVTSYNAALELINKDLPVSFVVPEDGVRLETHYSCVLKDNPTPEASELLLSWLYTPEGQQAMADTGVYSIFEDGPAPEGLPSTEDVLANAPAQPPMADYMAETEKTLELAGSVFR